MSGSKKIETKKIVAELEKAGRKPKHIFTAADEQHRLGKASSEEIELVEMRV